MEEKYRNRCDKCGATWESSSSSESCPRCGTDVFVESDLLEEEKDERPS